MQHTPASPSKHAHMHALTHWLCHRTCHRYSWSLDTFVDYAWASLAQLKIILVILLVVETLCVQVFWVAAGVGENRVIAAIVPLWYTCWYPTPSA